MFNIFCFQLSVFMKCLYLHIMYSIAVYMLYCLLDKYHSLGTGLCDILLITNLDHYLDLIVVLFVIGSKPNGLFQHG